MTGQGLNLPIILSGREVRRQGGNGIVVRLRPCLAYYPPKDTTAVGVAIHGLERTLFPSSFCAPLDGLRRLRHIEGVPDLGVGLEQVSTRAYRPVSADPATQETMVIASLLASPPTILPLVELDAVKVAWKNLSSIGVLTIFAAEIRAAMDAGEIPKDADLMLRISEYMVD